MLSLVKLQACISYQDYHMLSFVKLEACFSYQDHHTVSFVKAEACISNQDDRMRFCSRSTESRSRCRRAPL